ncbi:hypothetical protein [Methylobacterium indicum]|uniref:hypothetical protein n=1 Tax=Methylobacterium indicum TaxID=1775910 RepID=UPI000734890D|nr:hypothetical protein [Methylobacterium indicum]
MSPLDLRPPGASALASSEAALSRLNHTIAAAQGEAAGFAGAAAVVADRIARLQARASASPALAPFGDAHVPAVAR